MSQITIENSAGDNAQPIEWPLYKWAARFHILYWQAEIGDVVLNYGDSTTVATAMNDSHATARQPINIGTQNIAVATGSNNTIQFLIGPTAGATDTILLPSYSNLIMPR